MQKNKKYKAFTLVELIIVITILAILATVAFLSFQTYSIKSRDANRISTMWNIDKALSLFHLKTWNYPLPDGPLTIWTAQGNTIVNKWILWENLSWILWFWQTPPKDPFTWNPYVISVSENKKEYQFVGVLENRFWNGSEESAKVDGNYKWYITFSSGSDTMYSNVPSILWNNSWSVNLLDSSNWVNAPKYIVDNWENKPFVLKEGSLWDANTVEVLQWVRESSQATLLTLTKDELASINDGSSNKTEVLVSFWVPDIPSVTEVILAWKPISNSTPQTFTVTFDVNGWVGGQSGSIQKTKWALWTISAPSRLWYSFVWWNTQANGLWTDINSSSIIESDMTLYAKWWTEIDGTFSTTWRVWTVWYGNGNNTIEFYIYWDSASFNVDWGDGNIQTVSSALASHTYASAWDYTVIVTWKLRSFRPNWVDISNYWNSWKLISVNNWDNITWNSMQYMFTWTSNLTSLPSNPPNTTFVTSMYFTFSRTWYNQPINWDTRNVTNMQGMFLYATWFNAQVTFSDTSKVTNMSLMFQNATSFNKPLNFDTRSVTNMQSMFNYASAFNSPITFSDTSKVTNMRQMFYYATSFNQPLTFNSTELIDMYQMFHRAQSFNSPLSMITSKVTNMENVFWFSPFNQDISWWDVSKVTNMAWMFNTNTVFNQNLTSWWGTWSALVTTCNGFANWTTAWGAPNKPTFTNCTY